MKKNTWIAGITLAIFAGYVAAGPFLTIYQIKAGITEQDAEKLADNIDFPALRQNMKDQMNIAMVKNAATEQKDNPYAILAAGFASKFVDGMVDALITPSGLASIMSGKKQSQQNQDNGNNKTTDTASPKKDDLFKNARYSYDSLSKFSIWIPDNEGGEIRFVLKRNGISWKLVNLTVPMNKKQNKT